MIALLLALALGQADRGVDAGFSPVVLDVHHAELWLTTADGGSTDAPTRVQGGTWMDDATTEWLAGKKAYARGRESIGPDIDLRTLTLTTSIMFVIGVLAGAVLVWMWK